MFAPAEPESGETQGQQPQRARQRRIESVMELNRAWIADKRWLLTIGTITIIGVLLVGLSKYFARMRLTSMCTQKSR